MNTQIKTNDQFFNESEFWSKFIEDIQSCRKSLIIFSAFIGEMRVDNLIHRLHALTKDGVAVSVFTSPSDEHKRASQAQAAIASLRNVGVDIFVQSKIHQKLALIDREVLWLGSLNIMSHNDSKEIMLRTRNFDEDKLESILPFEGFGNTPAIRHTR